MENLDEVRRGGDGLRPERLLVRLAESLRSHVRDFDVVARSGDASFSVLLPEPGATPEDRVTALTRAVADDVAKDERLNEPVRVALAFGYALFPDEGTERDALLARASAPRIRML